MKKIIYLILAIILVLPLINAGLGIYKQNDCVKIRVLANCSNINLTEVSNSQDTFIINYNMTNLGGQTFNYTFCNTSTLGTYSYSWNNPCVDCSNGDCGNSFEVTVTGKSLDSAKSVAYVLIFIISFLIFLGLLIIGIALPISNKRDEMTGYIFAVSNLKYFKLLCLNLSYLAAMFISYFSWSVCYAYLDMDFMTEIFYFIFITLVILILPLFILSVYLTITNLVKDNEVGEYLMRGLHVK